jgi:hypothetical protein
MNGYAARHDSHSTSSHSTKVTSPVPGSPWRWLPSRTSWTPSSALACGSGRPRKKNAATTAADVATGAADTLRLVLTGGAPTFLLNGEKVVQATDEFVDLIETALDE